MNKIYFRHGTMFSGKSLNLISAVKTYEHNNQKALILKPSKDTRDKAIIKSRMSTETLECTTFNESDNLIDIFGIAYRDNLFEIDILFIDEVQFCTIEQIEQLHFISKYVPIMCYGLKTSYTGNLFPAITKLITIAEDVSEIKTICSMCKKKATHNLLLRNGQPVYSGDAINIEGENHNDEYKAVCRQHFYDPILKSDEKEEIIW